MYIYISDYQKNKTFLVFVLEKITKLIFQIIFCQDLSFI